MQRGLLPRRLLGLGFEYLWGRPRRLAEPAMADADAPPVCSVKVHVFPNRCGRDRRIRSSTDLVTRQVTSGKSWIHMDRTRGSWALTGRSLS